MKVLVRAPRGIEKNARENMVKSTRSQFVIFQSRYLIVGEKIFFSLDLGEIRWKTIDIHFKLCDRFATIE